MISSASTSAICSGNGSPNLGLVGLKSPACPSRRLNKNSLLRYSSSAARLAAPPVDPHKFTASYTPLTE